MTLLQQVLTTIKYMEDNGDRSHFLGEIAKTMGKLN